jgi:hypothetical protein
LDAERQSRRRQMTLARGGSRRPVASHFVSFTEVR